MVRPNRRLVFIMGGLAAGCHRGRTPRIWWIGSTPEANLRPEARYPHIRAGDRWNIKKGKRSPIRPESSGQEDDRFTRIRLGVAYEMERPALTGWADGPGLARRSGCGTDAGAVRRRRNRRHGRAPVRRRRGRP